MQNALFFAVQQLFHHCVSIFITRDIEQHHQDDPFQVIKLKLIGF
ncbi:Uncharacterised protein [Vibrio cholerae]|uniref:Uncharacterized protein n=1 Tax=Vibrio cholerae TaxID=666 RepID=A0A655RHJ9_VIBCL|nr:Uncharacterised protein [Vibrio cholerae]